MIKSIKFNNINLGVLSNVTLFELYYKIILCNFFLSFSFLTSISLIFFLTSIINVSTIFMRIDEEAVARQLSWVLAISLVIW